MSAKVEVCVECDGDGVRVIGWIPEAYENLEEDCPACSGFGLVGIPSTIYLHFWDDDGELLDNPIWTDEELDPQDVAYHIAGR